MYQFSVFGSPPSSAATAAGGCTCRLRRSRQSSHLTSRGKLPGLRPARAHQLGPRARRSASAGSGPPAVPRRRPTAPRAGPRSPSSRRSGRPPGSRRPNASLEGPAAPDALLVKRLEGKEFSQHQGFTDRKPGPHKCPSSRVQTQTAAPRPGRPGRGPTGWRPSAASSGASCSGPRSSTIARSKAGFSAPTRSKEPRRLIRRHRRAHRFFQHRPDGLARAGLPLLDGLPGATGTPGGWTPTRVISVLACDPLRLGPGGDARELPEERQLVPGGPGRRRRREDLPGPAQGQHRRFRHHPALRRRLRL